MVSSFNSQPQNKISNCGVLTRQQVKSQDKANTNVEVKSYNNTKDSDLLKPSPEKISLETD